MKPVLHPQTEVVLTSASKNPKGTYVFDGPTGIGKMTAAKWLSKSWHGHYDATGVCSRCIQIDANTYPDLIVISPEKDTIGIAQIQALQKRLNRSRHDNLGKRTIVIDMADSLTHEAQSALLKCAEEPPPDTIIILLVTSPKSLLTTLLSRSQVIRFFQVANKAVLDHLSSLNEISHDQVQLAAEIASGKIGLAIRLTAEPETIRHYQETSLLAQQLLFEPLFERLKLAAQITEAKTLSIVFLNEVMQQNLRRALRVHIKTSDTNQIEITTRAMRASMRLSQHLEANVAPKTALSAFALELN